jgi:glycosyltransferase involved in cell wall biosynthesis
LQEQMAPYRADLILLPNPIQIAAYPARLRTEAAPRLVWLRAYHHLYNPALALRTFEQLAGEFPALRLRMIGPDKGDGSAEQVRQWIAAHAFAGRIEQAGAVAKSDVPAQLDRGDIFLNTANADNTPVSVLEAMACGLCIVSTNVGGIPYLLEDGRDALLVPPDDEFAMAAAVRGILRTPRLAETLSRNARRGAEPFDWSAVLPKWEQLLETCRPAGRGENR